jgi:lysophospholipid acyltransferase (LPLAT)-like uncharacterized protein
MSKWIKGIKRVRNKLQRHFFPHLAVWVGIPLMHLFLLSCRFRFHGLERFMKVASQRQGSLVMLWHDSLLLVPHLRFRRRSLGSQRFALVISQSRDGEALDAVGKSYKGVSTIRVAASARHQALKEMVDTLSTNTHLLITPDGPNGPKHEIKPGVAFAAKATGAPVFPLLWRSSRTFHLPTWDKMRFPKPFSKVDVFIGEPLTFPPEEKLGTILPKLQEAMQQ